MSTPDTCPACHRPLSGMGHWPFNKPRPVVCSPADWAMCERVPA